MTENVQELEVVKEKQVVPVGNTPSDLLAIAVNQGADIDKLSKLMDLQDRWEKNEAKKAYNVAMSKAKESPPEINKDAEGHNKAKHASLGNVTAKVNAWLSEFGLHASWKTNQEDKSIFVTCTITHVMGHSESTTLSAGADSSGSKNAIQALGSTVTYLQRYTIFALTGLAAIDQDDDGNGASADNSKQEEWGIKCDECAEGGNLKEMTAWWPKYSAKIKKDLTAAGAAKIYDSWLKHKRKIEGVTGDSA